MTKTFVLLVVVLIAFSCTPLTDSGGEPKAITGNISYVNIVGFVDNTISATSSKSIIPAAATVEYAISPSLPDGLVLSKTGEITGTPKARSATTDNTNYVVTISGTGQYMGKIKSKSFTIAVRSSSLNSMDISSNSSIKYEDIVGTVGKRLTINPSTNILPSTATIAYSIDLDLPAGLTLSPSTGKISGIPTVESVSTSYVVTATAIKPHTGSISLSSFTIVIVDEKNINGFNLGYVNISGVVGTGLSIRPTNTIPPEATVTYSIDPDLPFGLALDSDGIIVGTPRELFVSTTLFQVTATAIEGYEGMLKSNEFAIEARIPITGSISYEAIAGSARSRFSASPSASFVPDIATVTYSIDPALPGGLILNRNTGKITGIPVAELGPTRYVVTASGTRNYAGNVDSDSFTLEITESTQTWTEGKLSYADFNGFLGTPVEQDPRFVINPAAAESSFRYAMTVFLGSFPEGLVFDPVTGRIRGTPTKIGSAVFRVTATAASELYTGIMVSNPVAIEITRIPVTGTLSYSNFEGSLGDTVSLSPTLAIDPAEAEQSLQYAMNISLGSFPEGLAFDPDTGAISGTPTKVGNTVLQITATAVGEVYEGTIESGSFTIVMPKIPITGAVSYSNFKGFLGDTVSLSPTLAIDPAEATVTYSISSTSLPRGLTLHPDTGLISGTINEISYVFIKITVTARGNYEGSLESNEFTIRIPIAISGAYEHSPTLIKGNVNVYMRIPISQNSIAPPEATVRYEEHNNSLPEGLSINLYTGSIEGTPRVATTGAENRVTKVTGIGLYKGTVFSEAFKVRIQGIRIGGEFYYRSYVLRGTIDVPFSVDTKGSAGTITPPGATVRYEEHNNGLPEGLSIHPDTGTIFGTPRVTTSGSYTSQMKVVGIGQYEGTLYTPEFIIHITEPIPLTGSITYSDLYKLKFTPSIFSFVPELTGTLADAAEEGMVEFRIEGYDVNTKETINWPVFGEPPLAEIFFSTTTGAISRRDIGRDVSGFAFYFSRFRVFATGKEKYTGTVGPEPVGITHIVYR